MPERVLMRRRLASGERLFGLGDRACPLDRRGRRYVLWNRDSLACALGRDPTYRSIPVVFGVRPGKAWCAVVESARRLVFDCRHGEVRVLADADAPVHVLEGETLADVLAAASEFIGRAPMPPRWALGYHQSRWSYRTAAEARSVVGEFRRRAIPVDALHLDIDYMDRFRVFTWDRERFPDPGALVDELGVHVVAVVDPGVKAEPGYRVYDELRARGYACRDARGEPWTGRVWPGRCAFPDFSRDEVRAWWGDLHAELVDAGVEGIWADMNEPSVFPFRTIPDAAFALHNAYGHGMAQATYEGLLRLRPKRRPFVLTRSAWLGTQRYAATWTGDNRSSWSHLRLSLRLCLGLSLSGFPFCGADVGGFAGRPSAELFVRWMQLGAFTPFFRTHYAGRFTLGRQEPWSFGPEAEEAARAAIELRHTLLPYTYTAFWRHTQTGLPLMRPLALAFPDDDHAVEREDEFLWGDSLLVAPVLRRRARRRPVYLPPGDWYDFWTGERHRGPGGIVADAPLDRIPLFVRAGSVIPLADGENRVYAGEGTSWLYEDDGESIAGPARVTRFEVDGDAVSSYAAER